MKNLKKKILSLILSVSTLLSVFSATGCGEVALQGTALAKALLAGERINHEHLSGSFDFLDDRLKENESTSAQTLSLKSFDGTNKISPQKTASTKGEIVSGSGDNAVYSWKSFENLVVELSYFESHFEAGQVHTEGVEENIKFIEERTSLKGKWINGLSYTEYLMQVEENRELVFENDTHNESYNVGIRTVNDEVNTTYESYENQGEYQFRTLSTPNRRYEYTTQNGDEVMAFVADNDNGYWRFAQMNSAYGTSLSLNIIIMTEDLAYSFTTIIDEDKTYSYDLVLISPDLKYEIAKLNDSEITIYPGSYTGIKELRVSQEEQKALGELGNAVAFTKDYGYYSTYAAPHIYTDKGVISAPVKNITEEDYLIEGEVPLDENVSYVDGNVRGLWEYVYPELTFNVKGDTWQEKFDNLHTALNLFGIKPIYNKDTVAKMAEDATKVRDAFHSHYVWNGEVLSSHQNAMKAYQIEKSKKDGYENIFSSAKTLPKATDQELVEIQQNLAFPQITLTADLPISVENGVLTLNGLTATVGSHEVLQSGESYVLRLALKKNTDQLEELVVLDNLSGNAPSTYSGDKISVSLSGKFNLPTSLAEGSYDLVAYVATANEGIRVSKFQRLSCVGQVNDQVTLAKTSLTTIITDQKVLNATYQKLFGVHIELEQKSELYDYDEVLRKMEDAVMDNGYFFAGAKLEKYDQTTKTYAEFTGEQLPAGTYRLEYLAQFDNGAVESYVYCEIA